MTPTKVLAAEYVIALGFVSYGAIRYKAAPWPPAIMRTTIAFGIISVLGYASPELAAVLAGGFLLAMLIKVLSSKEKYKGGLPDVKQGWTWVPITWGAEIPTN